MSCCCLYGCHEILGMATGCEVIAQSECKRSRSPMQYCENTTALSLHTSFSAHVAATTIWPAVNFVQPDLARFVRHYVHGSLLVKHVCLCSAALARSKGWAPRPLPQPKGGPAVAAEDTSDVSTSATAVAKPATAVKALPWKDPGLRFTSAPVIDDDYMMVSHTDDVPCLWLLL